LRAAGVNFITYLPETRLSEILPIPQLEALDVQYQVIRNADGLEHRIKDAVRMMNALKQPVALLFTADFTI
jgi:hypothetical protein